jgi:threonylcarbamoyladenosine tRNA methylthiotransferase MtaB
VLASCRRARSLRPGIALGADLIAGFPTESGTMFANTLAFVDEAELTHLHVFPYSARVGTPAARMPQLPGPVIRERAERLRAAGRARRRQWLAAQIGSTARLLVERDGRGHSEHYDLVRLVTPAPDGTIVTARVTGTTDDALLGQAIAV